MSDKKYQLIKRDYIDIKHPTAIGNKVVRLYRILALKTFQNPQFGEIKEGEIGGYVQSEDNLSHDGTCWIAHTAKVFDTAIVKDDAIVQDNAGVFETAQVVTDSVIKGLARIRGSAIVDSCKIGDKSDVLGSPKIFNVTMHNSARIYGNATVSHTIMSDGAMIHGDAQVFKSVLKDISEIRGNAVVHQGQYTGRSIITEGERINETLHADVDLAITVGKGEL